MAVWLFNQVFYNLHYHIVLQRTRHSLLVIYLLVNFVAFVVTSLCNFHLYFHPLPLTEFSLELRVDAQCNVHCKPTRRCSWRPNHSYFDPFSLFIDC